MADRLESSPVLDQLSGQSPDLCDRHADSGERLHGWVEFVPYASQVVPICCCGWHGPFAIDRDAAFDLICERGELERADAARRALIGR